MLWFLLSGLYFSCSSPKYHARAIYVTELLLGNLFQKTKKGFKQDKPWVADNWPTQELTVSLVGLLHMTSFIWK